MAPVASEYIGSLFFGGSCYAFLGLMTYTVVNRGRPFDLPQWYLGSARGPRETVLVCLWFPAVVALWPLVLPPCLAARLGFRVPERLGAMARRVRDRGRRMCGGGGGGGGRRRDGVDLERWADVSLDDGERAAGAGGPATWGGFVNPFEGRGRSRSRTHGPEASESRSPRDRGGGDDGSTVAGSEQQQQQQWRPPAVWYTKLPSPAEMIQSAMGQTFLGDGSGDGGSSSSSGERGRSPPGHDNGHGNDNSSAPLVSRLPQVAHEVVDSGPAGKAQVLQRLQTIPEDEGGDLGVGREDARVR